MYARVSNWKGDAGRGMSRGTRLTWAASTVIALVLHGSWLFAETLGGDVDLHVIGVYEGHTHKYGKVTVFVAERNQPIFASALVSASSMSCVDVMPSRFLRTCPFEPGSNCASGRPDASYRSPVVTDASQWTAA